MEPIEVTARFDKAGQIWPVRFVWRDRAIQVEGAGRRWEEGGNRHMLVMAMGGQVFELIFQPETGIWGLKAAGRAHPFV